jgi:hypothetical protein
MTDTSRLELSKFGTTTLIAIITIGIGFMQYGFTSSFSVRQPFITKQTDLCLAASEHASRLATTRNPAAFEKSREEFWMLYWGPLAVVEDVETRAESRVALEMRRFGDAFKPVDTPNPTLPLEGLTTLAINLAHACRDLLGSKWQVGVLQWFRH